MTNWNEIKRTWFFYYNDACSRIPRIFRESYVSSFETAIKNYCSLPSSPTLSIDVCIYRVQNVFLRCPTPRLHCFLSSHWPSFSFLSFMALFIPSIQFFFGLPRAMFRFGIHFNAILGSLHSAILWTWPYHVSVQSLL